MKADLIHNSFIFQLKLSLICTESERKMDMNNESSKLSIQIKGTNLAWILYNPGNFQAVFSPDSVNEGRSVKIQGLNSFCNTELAWISFS